MRKVLIRNNYNILIIKYFSHFINRNSRGLVELGDLHDSGVRIISIGDGIYFPNESDPSQTRLNQLDRFCFAKLDLIKREGWE